jgi:hypothetical protein
MMLLFIVSFQREVARIILTPGRDLGHAMDVLANEEDAGTLV